MVQLKQAQAPSHATCTGMYGGRESQIDDVSPNLLVFCLKFSQVAELFRPPYGSREVQSLYRERQTH